MGINIKKIEYTLVQSSTAPADLIKNVQQKILAGWKPLGSPTISVSETDNYYYFNGFQAMTRER